jgi:hypothetical protein
MSRYVSKPPEADFGYWEQPAPPLPHPTVFASEPIRTGLLDKDGNDIFRMPDPIGFLAK